MTPNQYPRARLVAPDDVLLGDQFTGQLDVDGNKVFRTVGFPGFLLTGLIGVDSPLAVDGLVATGNTQGSALQLNAVVNVIGVVGLGTGVILPPGTVNARILVLNRGQNELMVYPPTNAQIERLGLNMPGQVPANGGAWFISASGNPWYVD
jgi:hypothetical protein